MDLLEKDTDPEISQKMFVAHGAVHRIQIQVVVLEAGTAVEENERSAASMAAQYNLVEVANLADRLVGVEAVQMPLV